MLEVTDQNFESEIIKAGKMAIVDFWAPWCGPCRMMAPVFEALEVKNPDVKFAKINVDENNQTANKYRVASIPAVLLFKDEIIKDMSVGAVPEAALQKFIDRNK